VRPQSLSLFDDTPQAGGNCPAAVAVARDAQQRHLAAARRLSRRMARLPDQSPEQERAGLLICRHLVAMLNAAQQDTQTPRH
jgi:hypothetical protein